jgi:hypothetical protein
MESRTFLRIEGDLVSLVTEVIDREVSLPDLLTELTTATVAMTPRLPTGCRFWIRSGTTDRSVFVLVKRPPIRCAGLEPNSHPSSMAGARWRRCRANLLRRRDGPGGR